MEPLVIVTWRDAHFHHEEDAVPETYEVRTVGFLLADDPEVQLAQEQLPDADGHRAITCIPCGIVDRIDYLELAPEVKPHPMTAMELIGRNVSTLEAFAAPA